MSEDIQQDWLDRKKWKILFSSLFTTFVVFMVTAMTYSSFKKALSWDNLDYYIMFFLAVMIGYAMRERKTEKEKKNGKG